MRGKRKQMIAVLLPVLLIGLAGCGFTGQNNILVSTEKLDSAAFAGEGASDGETWAQEKVSSTDSAPSRYAYSTLTDTEKVVYDEIVSAFYDRAEDVTLSTTETAEMEKAYLAVRSDHCELFWVDTFVYETYTERDVVTEIHLTPEYTMTAEEQADLQSRVDAEADRMLAEAPTDGSDFDKALYVYETLIREVDYDVTAENGQTILSAFLEHATVCQGYAYATQYLLERLDIPCATVTGTAAGETHAWNLVFLDGAYYYLDTTWGNSLYVNRNDPEAEEILPYKYVDYDYFGMTTEMMQTGHQPDNAVPLPVCEATADNYYVHEGLYIDTWDPDAIGAILQQGYYNGQEIVCVRFADAQLYQEARQYFLTDGGVFAYCYGLQQVRYLDNPANEVMTVVFPESAASSN